jgi:outer membrane lipoprotein SlyB
MYVRWRTEISMDEDDNRPIETVGPRAEDTLMNTQVDHFSRPLMWVAGIAVILFSLAGIGAIMGWIPTSMGRGADNTDIAVPDKNSAVSGKPPYKAPAAAAAHTAASSARCSDCGVIESSREVSTKGEGSGIGAAGGAVVGGLIGNQIGNGRGNTVATVLGAVGGAVGGNEVEKRVKASKGYEVTVRMDDGSSRVISETNAPAFRAGDHVRIVNGVIRANP